MQRINSIEDQMNGVVTYALSNGQRARFSAQAVAELGAAECMRRIGLAHLIPKERVPVFWCGRRIGTMAPDFDPAAIKSKSFLYDPRPGDFERDGDRWLAAQSLGPGDLDCVPGFQRDASEQPSQ